MSDDAPPPGSALARLADSLGKQRGPPPVDTWSPPYCGAIDMRIAADGTWFYMGTPITRPALVKLFSTVLRRETDGSFALVTPVERVGITVEDAPFEAVEMAVDGEGEGRRIALRTNVDDLVEVGPEHPLRFETGEADGGVRPYVHVRRDLWARVTRALAYDLLDLGEERAIDGEDWFGLAAGGAFHRVARSTELEAGSGR